MLIALLLSVGSLVVAPWFATKMMSLRGGLGKAAVVGLVSLGLMQIIGLAAPYLGPLGGLVTLMAGIAAWFQVVKVVHGTDIAQTIVFMFWQLFFLLLASSLLALAFNGAAVSWYWRG